LTYPNVESERDDGPEAVARLPDFDVDPATNLQRVKPAVEKPMPFKINHLVEFQRVRTMDIHRGPRLVRREKSNLEITV